jgi:hypothetical protein
VTKKLEDFFNLPPAKAAPEEVEEYIESEITEVIELPVNLAVDVHIPSALTNSEKVNFALPVVTGLEQHDNEMDTLARKAMATFEDLISLGGNVPDMHAGKIYEVAGQMLKTALDAKNSKADKKLKMIELQLKKVRSEQIDIDQGNGVIHANGGEFDRNELLKYIISDKNSQNSDK